jgi:hypothetical protein
MSTLFRGMNGKNSVPSWNILYMKTNLDGAGRPMKGVGVVFEICSCGLGNHSRLREQQHHELPSNLCECIVMWQISLLRHNGKVVHIVQTTTILSIE